MLLRSAFVVASSLAFAVASFGKQGSTTWVPLPMRTPPSVQSALLDGEKNPGDVVHLSIAIPYRDPIGMQKFVDSVSDPKSPTYRHFITPDEVGSRFGMPQADVQAVADYLTSQGISVKLVAKNRLSILADATVAQAEAAFHTSIKNYIVASDGTSPSKERFCFTTAPSVPASIRSYVTYVEGLENFTQPKAAYESPSQLRTLYSLAPIYNSGNTGSGRTVAISNWDGYRLSNIPLEYAQFGLATPPGGAGSNVTVVSINGSDGNTYPPGAEGDIDIQCTLAMAPLCNFIIYDDAGDGDYLGVLTREANDNSADFISESWGWSSDPSLFAATHNVHLSMSAQGITYMCASGDSGTDWPISWCYPDEDPEVMTVGGTTVSTTGVGVRTSEVGWSGSGGGWNTSPDSFDVLPSWQHGTGVPTGGAVRLVPDLALDADPGTGYEIFINGGLQVGWGGTSCASPTLAGSLADSAQAIIAGGGLPPDGQGKRRFGRIQDLIYSFNGVPSVFYDVTQGNNGTLPNGSQSNAGAGWDTVTGWGAPIFTGFVNIVLNPPVLAGFSINPTAVLGGATSTGTVSIADPAPASGTTVYISANDPSVIVPGSVTIPSGQTSTQFTINTNPVSAVVHATISATEGGPALTANLTVNPPTPLTVTFVPSSVVGGASSTGTVTLNGPAPSDGISVSLSSNNSHATVPGAINIAPGSTTGTFTARTTAVSSDVTASITAVAGGSSQSGSLTITAATVSSLNVNPDTVTGGTPSTGTVTLTGAAGAGGSIVTLSSTSSSAIVPISVTVPAGNTTATFSINTTAVSAQVVATIKAVIGSNTVTSTLTINPPALATVGLSPSSVIGGNPSTGTVTLNGPAPSTGVAVTLTSDSSSATVPASVTVSSGRTSATFTVTTVPVSLTMAADITAKVGSVSQTATLTVQAPSIASISVSPNPAVGGNTLTGTVQLAGTATANAVVNLSSSNTSVATVPSTVTVAKGHISATFSVSTRTVTANASTIIYGFLDASSGQTSLLVTPLTLAGFTLSTNATYEKMTVTGTVTLNGAALSGGAVVQIANSDPSVASMPSSVTVPSGSTSKSFTITAAAVTSPKSTVITASRNGVSFPQTLNVSPIAIQSVQLTPTLVVGGTGVQGVVRLAMPAPAGGVSVAVSSSYPSVAKVPPSLSIASGATSATFSVTTTPVGQTYFVTIGAQHASSVVTTQLQVIPPEVSTFKVSPTSTKGGKNVTGTVTLTGKAPAGGMTVTVTANPNLAAPTKTVVVPAGATSASFTIATQAVTSTTPVTLRAYTLSVLKTAVLTLTP